MLLRRIYQFFIIYLLGIALLFALKYTLRLSDYVIPSPDEIWRTSRAYAGPYLLAVLNTLAVAILGHLLSICLATAVAVLGRLTAWVGSFIRTAAYNIQAYPIVAVAPIIFILLGDGTRLGHKRTLAFGATLFGAYPLLLGLAHGPALFWVASFIGGGAWGITNVGLTNRLMEKVPDDQRPAGMAVHNLVLNLGILMGSLAAPLLGEWVGLQPALFVVAALRFLAGGIFWVWG